MFIYLAPTLNASPMGVLMTPSTPTALVVQDASAMYIPVKENELLSKMITNGFQVLYRYTRTPHLFSAYMTSIQLILKNLGQEDLTDVKIGAKTLSAGMALHEFPAIASLAPGSTQSVNIGVNFNDSTQAAKFDMVVSGRVFSVQIQSQIGELIRAVSMPESTFEQERSKLRGMNEVDVNFNLPSASTDEASIKKKIYETANVLQVPALNASEDGLKFAGQTTANHSLVLITFKVNANAKATLTVNCEKIVIGNMLAKEISQAFNY